jgi:hypothetical protein
MNVPRYDFWSAGKQTLSLCCEHVALLPEVSLPLVAVPEKKFVFFKTKFVPSGAGHVYRAYTVFFRQNCLFAMHLPDDPRVLLKMLAIQKAGARRRITMPR